MQTVELKVSEVNIGQLVHLFCEKPDRTDHMKLLFETVIHQKV